MAPKSVSGSHPGCPHEEIQKHRGEVVRTKFEYLF